MEGKEGRTDSNSRSKSSGGTENVMNPVGTVDPDAHIAMDLFDGKNYKEWSYSARIAIGGAK